MVGSRRVQGAESAPTEGALGAPPHVGHRRRRVFTAEDGWVWTFAAVDHWNAECMEPPGNPVRFTDALPVALVDGALLCYD